MTTTFSHCRVACRVFLVLLSVFFAANNASAVLTLSKATSTNGIADAFYKAYLNNVIPIQPNTTDTAVGRNFLPNDPGVNYSGWQIKSVSLQAQSSQQTVDGGAVWTVTIFEWQPATNLFDMRYWTNGTDADPLAGFPSVKIILRDSGSLGTSSNFSGNQFLNFKFDTNSTYFLEKTKAYGIYFTRANATNTFTAQAGFGAPGAASFRKQVGTPGALINLLELGLLVEGTPVTKPQLSAPQFVTVPAAAFQMNLTGRDGMAYTVECSTNLAAWNTLTNLTGAAAGVSIVDTNVNGANSRFYRAYQTP